MTATLTTGFQSHLARRSHALCWLLRLELKDGTVIGSTDHSDPIDYDIGGGSITYRTDLGLLISNVQTGTGMDAGNYEITVPVKSAGPFTRQAIIGGRFNRCEARLARFVWSDPANGIRKTMLGNAGEWRLEGDKAIVEVRDQRDRLNQTTGRIIQNQCDADYADQVKCFATPTEITATVTGGTAESVNVSYSGSYADGTFNGGELIGLTGKNAGLTVPIWKWDETSAGVATISNFFPMVDVPDVGDTFTVRDGCLRTRTACKAHGQILNFRGFPEVPGVKALKPAIPPSSGGSGGKGGK